MLRLNLFGTASIDAAGVPVTGRAAHGRRLALLALLACARGRCLTRDKLIALLSPETSTAHARRQLSDDVYLVRSALGDGVLRSNGDKLSLDSTAIESDVETFERLLDAGRLEDAVELVMGPLLDGFHLSDGAEFEHWLDGERARLEQRYAAALQSLAEACEAGGQFAEAAAWWRKLAVHDPCSSRVALGLMRALEAAGDRAGAIRHARVHAALLRDELDAEPEPELSALAERMRSAPSAPATEPVFKAPLTSSPLAPVTVGSLPPAAHGSEGEQRRWREWPAAWRRISLMMVAVGGIAGLLAAFWPRTVPPLMHPLRVVVAPFDNRTGDPSLDMVGEMTADWITADLARMGVVDVVGASAALTAARHVRRSVADQPALDPVPALAAETGAGLVVSGAYYRKGDSIQFAAYITDAQQNRLVQALAPVSAPVTMPSAGIELLRQRALGALAPLLDVHLGGNARLAAQPPSYAAYRAYAEGRQLTIQGGWRESIPHFARALALDSTYLLPLLITGWAYLNSGQPDKADSVARLVHLSRDRLTPFESASLDMLVTFLGSDPGAQYQAARRAALLAPGSTVHAQWAIQAARLNRPREALRILADLDPSRGELRGWSAYWSYLTESHHLRGSHRRELREARRARGMHPDDTRFLWLEARALAALGRLADVEALLEHRLMLPATSQPSPALLMRAAAHELRLHGHTAAARTLDRRLIAWHGARMVDDDSAETVEFGLALAGAGHLHEAQAHFRRLAAAEPEQLDHQGMLGTLAALLGHHAEAIRIDARLAASESPYRKRASTYWRACIAAGMGQQHEAVMLLRQAFGEGLWHGHALAAFPHSYYCLEPLRGYGPFRELVRPAG